MKKFALLTSLLFALTLFACAQMGSQDKSKRPSPPASAECKFSDGQTVKIDYSSPRMKSRKIFGGLVPYGQIWRTGANEATTFVTSADLTIGGQSVPAGSYALFTIPEADKWTLVISKKTGSSVMEQNVTKITELNEIPADNLTAGEEYSLVVVAVARSRGRRHRLC